RFFAPLYPCLAVLVGAVVERLAGAEATTRLRVCWRSYLTFLAGVMLLTAIAVAAGPFLPAEGGLECWPAPPYRAVGYSGAIAALALVTWKSVPAAGKNRERVGVLAVAAFMGVLLIGVGTDVRQRRAADPLPALSDLQAKLPPGQ